MSDPISLWRAETFWSKEPETIEWLTYFGNKENSHCRILVDVGANIGIYTLYWCSLNKNLLTISIEPFDENYKLLVRNTEMNDFTDQVKFLKQPLSSQKNMEYMMSLINVQEAQVLSLIQGTYKI